MSFCYPACVCVRAHELSFFLCAHCEWVRRVTSSIRELKLKGMCGKECWGAFMSRPIVHSQPTCSSSSSPLSTSVSISLFLSLSHSHTFNCSLLITLSYTQFKKCLSTLLIPSLSLSPCSLVSSLSLCFLSVSSWWREARLSCGLNWENVEWSRIVTASSLSFYCFLTMFFFLCLVLNVWQHNSCICVLLMKYTV